VLEQLYEAFPRFEAAFDAALAESLHPRGPEVLFELVERMGLPAGSQVLDVGCGEGRHTLELARRFGFDVVGIDPVPRQIEVARASADPGVRFELERPRSCRSRRRAWISCGAATSSSTSRTSSGRMRSSAGS
jgi:trans-aconitate methyltransferase